MSVATFENVTKFYRQPAFFKPKKILGIENLSLKIEEGEIFGLLGLNGNGKTTALRLLLGLINPTKGQVQVRVSAGYLPENIVFPPRLTPFEILRFLDIGARRASQQKISDVLKTVGLFEVKDRRAGGFSRGMTQRLGIAQAILQDPKILVLDEPTLGLDPLGVIEMRELFLRLNAELKITILFSSHIISEVEKISHRVGILTRNRLKGVFPRSDWSRGKTLEEVFVDAVKN